MTGNDYNRRLASRVSGLHTFWEYHFSDKHTVVTCWANPLKK